MLTRVLVVLIVVAQPLFASLQWEQTKISLRANTGEESAVGVFKFSNAGEQAVTIVNVGSSCGCTVPALAKRTYAPGESGEITAKFTFGGRVGRQVKTVTVTTDAAAARPTVLMLEVEIPELVQIRPLFLLWRRGDPAAPKMVTVRVLEAGTDAAITVVPPDDRFAATVETTDEPGLYHVRVTPKDTAAATHATLRLNARVGETVKQVSLIAGIR